MWILFVVMAGISIVALVETARLFNSGNDANKAVDDLRDALAAAGLLSSDCFTCDTNTGEMVFNSTIDLDRAISNTENFFEGGGDNIGRGLQVPGFAFYGAPATVPDRGSPLFTGDVVFAPNSGLDQNDQGLPLLEPNPSSYELAQTPNPSPMGFGPVWLLDNSVDPPVPDITSTSTIRIGTFTTEDSSQSDRCRPADITPSPTAYFLVDNDSGSTVTMHLCVCVSNQGGVGAGSGEHCTSAQLIDNFFPAGP
jgi:hypothetical protein